MSPRSPNPATSPHPKTPSHSTGHGVHCTGVSCPNTSLGARGGGRPNSGLTPADQHSPQAPRDCWAGGWRGLSKRLGGGYFRLQMPLKPAPGVRGTVAGHRLGGPEGGGRGLPPSNAPLPPWALQCVCRASDWGSEGAGGFGHFAHLRVCAWESGPSSPAGPRAPKPLLVPSWSSGNLLQGRGGAVGCIGVGDGGGGGGRG